MISVIIPIYNMEKYIHMCITSILNQSYKDIEIVLVNDGSSDSSGEICDEYKKKDKRVKVIHQSNSGVSRARNIGLLETTGEWITYVDGDDWIDENTFEIAMSKLNDLSLDILAWNRIDEYENKSKLINYYSYETLSLTNEEMEDLRYRIFTGFSPDGKKEDGARNIYAKLIRKSLICQNHLFFDEDLKHHEDVIFMIRLFEKSSKVLLLNEHWYHRRMRNDSTISRYSPEIIKMNKIASYKYYNFLKENTKDKRYYDFMVGLHVWWFIRMLKLFFFHKDCHLKFVEKLRKIRSCLLDEPYKNVFSSINVKIKFSKKLFVILARYKMISLIYIYYLIFIEKENVKNFYQRIGE